jgi:hypothetical protein
MLHMTYFLIDKLVPSIPQIRAWLDAIHCPTHTLTLNTGRTDTKRAQIYLFGGKTMSAAPAINSSEQQAPEYNVTNNLFSLETDTADKIPVWKRLPDGPPGVAVFDFVMVAVNDALWIHGGETADGEARPTLWSIQTFDNVDTSAFGGAPVDLEPLWSVHGFQGMGARKRHCAAAIGDTMYFFGGVTSACLHPVLCSACLAQADVLSTHEADVL